MARGVVESFADWARSRPGLEPDVVETLVDLKANYLDDRQPGRWRSGDLSDLLLEWVPRKVSADDEWYDAVVPTARAFLTWLHSRGELHRGSAPLASLLAELDGVAAEFTDAVHDPARSGMAKGVLGAVGLADVPDQAELDEAMARFNALPFAERDAALARFLPASADDDDEDDSYDDDEEDDGYDELPDTLPGVRLAPIPELAAAASASATLQELAQLDAWLGDGRAVTATGVLTHDEARSLQEALGWQAPSARDVDLFGEAGDSPAGTEVRSAHDLARVSELWRLASAIGAVVVEQTRAVPGPARRVLRDLVEAGDDDVLEIWQAAFEEVLYPEHEDREWGLDQDVVSGAVRHAVVASYEDDDHTVDQLADEAFEDSASEEPVAATQITRALFTTYVRSAVARLNALGATTPAQGVDDYVSLTPLGKHGLRTIVVEDGGSAPLIEDVAGLPADQALAQILAAGPDLAGELVLEWLTGRELRPAVRELLLVLRGLPAALRHQTLTLLVTIDDVPGLLAELSTGDPLLAPIVRGVLADVDVFTHLRLEGMDGIDDLDDLSEEMTAELVTAVQGLSWRAVDLPPSERDVLVVDSLARAVFDLEEPVRTEDVHSAYWSLLDEPTVLHMTGSGHPEADAVLRAISTGHPAGRIRKAAKKALHKRGMALR